MLRVEAVPPLGNQFFGAVGVQQGGEAELHFLFPVLDVGKFPARAVLKLDNPPLFAQAGVLRKTLILHGRQLPQQGRQRLGGLLSRGVEFLRGVNNLHSDRIHF